MIDHGGPSTLVRTERHDGVAVLSINAPPLNLLTQSLRRAIRDAVERADSDESVRAIVLTGDVNFCAGADLKEFAARRDPATAEAHCRNGHAMTRALACGNKPVIAAIEGACLGGGFEIALACDVRIAANNARLGVPEISRGVFPGTGGIFLLERLIGPARAKRLMFFGEIFAANASDADGIVDQRTDPGATLTTALALGHKLAAQPALSIRAIKTLTDHQAREQLARYLDVETAEYIACYQRNDSLEGWRSFLEKRQPSWTHT